MAIARSRKNFDGVVYCHECRWLPDVVLDEYLDYEVHLIMEKHSEETGHLVSCYANNKIALHTVGRIEK